MVRMTRERALSEREFEWLLCGAGGIDDPTRRMEARALLLIGGRLGLRPGEVTHLDESWIDRRREMIHIPAHHPCEMGRGGSPCGTCRQAARQMQTHNGGTVEEYLADRWEPKTPAAVRDVPFGFSKRTAVAIERLVDEHGGWPHSFSTIQRRLETALDHAPNMTSESTTPHGLRGTAASYHAGRGLDAAPLQSMFGWEDLQTARNYVSVDGEMTRRALGEIHG